jgi:hypothetical protein
MVSGRSKKNQDGLREILQQYKKYKLHSVDPNISNLIQVCYTLILNMDTSYKLTELVS